MYITFFAESPLKYRKMPLSQFQKSVVLVSKLGTVRMCGIRPNLSITSSNFPIDSNSQISLSFSLSGICSGRQKLTLSKFVLSNLKLNALPSSMYYNPYVPEFQDNFKKFVILRC